MQNWSRLILPLGLGIAAACMNASVVSDKVKPETVLAAGRDIKAGERITDKDLLEIDVPANAGNRRHFWLASQRQSLLIARTAAVDLRAGELIPKDVHLRDARPRFLIPDGHTVVCYRLREDLINPQWRYQLRPGCPVSVKLQHETAPLPYITLAFLEMVPTDDKRKGAAGMFQIGLVVRNDEALLARIAGKGIVSVEGSAD